MHAADDLGETDLLHGDGHITCPGCADAQLLHAAQKILQAPLQRGEQRFGLPAALKIGDDFLVCQPHRLEFLSLQDARHAEIVVVPPPAVGIDMGGGQQSLCLHAHQRAARKTAGTGSFVNLKQFILVIFVHNSSQKVLLRSGVNML